MQLKQSLGPRVGSGVSARICFSASRIKSAVRCLDLPRDHDDMLPLLPRLCRQTTTMYGRPEGSASSCLRAFDNSIIPTRSDRSISVSESFSAQFFFSTIHRTAKIFEGPKGYRAAAIASRRDKKTWFTYAAHWRDHLEFIFASARRFYAPKVERSVRNDGVPLFNRHIPRAVGLISQA